jgi:hypothetical protein
MRTRFKTERKPGGPHAGFHNGVLYHSGNGAALTFATGVQPSAISAWRRLEGMGEPAVQIHGIGRIHRLRRMLHP